MTDWLVQELEAEARCYRERLALYRARRRSMVSKQFEDNEDWIKREEGRIPTKGAIAAERASAGLGTSDDDDDAVPLKELSAPLTVWPNPVPRSPRPGKP